MSETRRGAGEDRSSAQSVRVLHVHSGNLFGGIEVWLTRTAKANKHYGVDADFALCFEGRTKSELEAQGMAVHALGPARLRSPLTLARARRALRTLLAEQKYDVVLAHSTWTLAVFGATIRASGVPLVFHVHDSVHNQIGWLDRLAQRTRPDLALCNSDFTAGTIDRIYPSIRRTTFRYGFDAPVTPPDARAVIRRELGIGDDDVMILQASRMQSWKGHELHLEALALLHRRNPTAKWVCIIAGGAQRPEEEVYLAGLLRTVAENDLEGRVRFIGQRSDVPSLMVAADVFCQPNKTPEPFGVVFVEALDAGLPVVSVAMGGVLETVDPSCSILVPPGDAEGLAEALERLVDDAPFRFRLSAPARARARAVADPAIQTGIFREALLSVVLSCGVPSVARMPRPYVLVANEFVGAGGEAPANYALARHLARTGHETHLVAFNVAPELEDNRNLHVHITPRPPGPTLLRPTALGTRGLFEVGRMRHGSEVVVSGASCPAANAVNWVHYVHAAAAELDVEVDAARWVARTSERLAIKRARLVLANSQRTRGDLLRLLDADDSRIRVVYPGVEGDRFVSRMSVDRDLVRAQLGWDERPRVVFAGDVGDRRQGFDTLFAAWVRLCAGSSWDGDLVVATPETGHVALRRRVERSAAEGRVAIVGERDDVSRLLRASDLLVAPSRYEPYGESAHEALAHDLPAITSQASGIAEHYPEDLQGWLLPDPKDDVDLSERITRWRESSEVVPASLTELGTRLRRRTWDVVAREIVEIIERD